MFERRFTMLKVLLSLVLDKVRAEPLVVVGVLASIVTVVAGHLGIVLDHASVQNAIEPVAVALLARQWVVPHGKHKELRLALAAAEAALAAENKALNN
jgi:hypothetical protein